MDSLPIRQQHVLQAIVQHYVDTIEPVGSRTLVQRFGLEASTATIRSAMGALEHKGFLTQPHKSAGRVPSPQGYRHYVDCLLPPPSSAIQYLQSELANLSLTWVAFDDLLWTLSRRLTDFTGLMSLITRPVRDQKRLEKLRLVQSSDRLLVMVVETSNQATHLNLRLPIQAAQEIEAIESWACDQLAKSKNGNLNWSCLPSHLHTSGSILKEAIQNYFFSGKKVDPGAVFNGMSNLLSQPEFSTGKKCMPLLELLDNQPAALVPSKPKNVRGVWIGSEHPNSAMIDCSVVKASYRSSGEGIGQVALVGPMRMAYSTAMAAVTIVANYLDRILS